MPDEPRILLASASPRRRRLLAWLGLPYLVTSTDTPEDLDVPLASDPPALAAALAAEKAVAARAGDPRSAHLPVLAFDTIVVLDGRVLGKPADIADARRMLRALSGREHEVVTGVAVFCPGAVEPDTFSLTTRVRMRDLDDAAIDEWIGRGEALGCAGAYNIEGQVADVSASECYQNVAGLPLCHLRAELLGRLAACVRGTLGSPVAECERALGRRCDLGRRIAR